MAMGMGGAGPWQTYRSFTRDRSVAEQRVSRDTVRRILGFARPYRWEIGWFLVTLVVGSLLVVAQPLLFRRIVDDGITPGDSTVVTVSALLVLALALADAAIGLVGRWFSARIGEGLIYDLRTDVFGHVQAQPLAFFTRTQTGALISRLNSDVIGAQQAFTSTLGGVVGNLISLVVVLVAMFLLSWPITLISLVLLPLFLLPARWMGRRLQAQTREQMQLNADMSTMMTERFNVSGALLVKLFGRPQEEVTSFSGKAARVRDIGVQIAMSNRYFFTALTLVASVATAIAYGVGGNLVIDGTLTIGTLLALTALLARLYGPLTALSNVRVDVMTALVSFDRVFEVLDLRPLVAQAPDARPIPRGPTSVELRDVHFTYPGADEVSLASLESVARSDGRGRGEPVLQGVDLRIEPGQMFALVGPSGAGKSTITALVTRLYDVTSGAVEVGGVDVREATLDSLSDAIGVVTQDAHMFHDTIRGNLVYARPGATDEQILAACRDAQIGDLVASLPDGLDTVVGERGYRLSGGEKQRLAIARLLLRAPAVVVLDEATAHLDSESEAAVQRALATALEGRTSLVVAHRLSTIRAADQILVIDAGRVVQRGTHQQLLAAGGLYADLSRTQFGMEPAEPAEAR
jgi:ATP-binding cassette subfamily B protein